MLSLCNPISVHACQIRNRFVMAPMTRAQSPGNIPNEQNKIYYTARAAGGVGLIITEGTYINAYAGDAGFQDPTAVPNFYGKGCIEGWKKIVTSVHEAEGKIFPQLWHVGSVRQSGLPPRPDQSGFGPSPIIHPYAAKKEPALMMNDKMIEETIQDYVRAATLAQQIGFDGVELHGAHGYLIDQFFWNVTNKRTDRFGGDILSRTRFACEIIAAIRQAVGPQFPICLRFSQWKLGDYHAQMLKNPKELELFLTPLLTAGVDIFHCSTRRFFEPEFENSSLNLAGWVKKITGALTITVGSIGLSSDFIEDYLNLEHVYTKKPLIEQTLEELSEHIDKGEFDFIALGRALIADSNFPNKVFDKNFEAILPFKKEMVNNYP